MAEHKNILQRIGIGGYEFSGFDSFTEDQKHFAMCLIKMAYKEGLEEGAADIKSRIFYALEVQPEIEEQEQKKYEDFRNYLRTKNEKQNEKLP